MMLFLYRYSGTSSVNTARWPVRRLRVTIDRFDFGYTAPRASGDVGGWDRCHVSIAAMFGVDSAHVSLPCHCGCRFACVLSAAYRSGAVCPNDLECEHACLPCIGAGVGARFYGRLSLKSVTICRGGPTSAAAPAGRRLLPYAQTNAAARTRLPRAGGCGPACAT